MYILLSSLKTVYQVTTRGQRPSGNDVSTPAQASFYPQLTKVLAQQRQFESQQTHLNAAAQAAFAALNPLDRLVRKFKISLDLTSSNDSGISFEGSSSSAGLGYALALALAYREQLGKTHDVNPFVFATGEVYGSGEVHAIGHLETKVKAACHFMAQLEHFGETFVITYPKANDAELSDDLRQMVEAQGGKLLPITRIQEVLTFLLGDEYDGEPEGHCEPFKGLASFEFRDQFRFFGRDRAIEKLKGDYDTSEGLLIVTGVSGSGKSSLVKAGLLPALKKEASNTNWLITEPKLHSSRVGLLSYLLERTPKLVLEQKPMELAGTLLEQPEKAQTLVTYKDVEEKAVSPLLWYIDQYEDTLNLYQDTSIDFTIFSSVLDSLAKAVPWLRVVVSIRSEYFEPLEQAGSYASSLVSKTIAAEDWRAIVHKQAAYFGLKYDDGLEEQIINEALNVNHALPAVEYLLTSMYELAKEQDPHARKLTYAHYEHYTINCLRGVIAAQAEKVMERHGGLSDEFFEYFIGSNTEGQVYARSVPLNEIRENRPELYKLVQEMIQAQLVIESQYQDQQSQPKYTTFVKLAHDCLFNNESQSIENYNGYWKRLQGWLQSRKKYLLWLANNESRFNEWQKERRFQKNPGRDLDRIDSDYLLDNFALDEGNSYLSDDLIARKELRQYITLSQQNHAQLEKLESKKQRRRFNIALFLIIIASGFAVLARVKWIEAATQTQLVIEAKNQEQKEKERAEQQTLLAIKARDQAEAERKRTEVQKLKAEEQTRIAKKQKKIAEQQTRVAEKQKERAEDLLSKVKNNLDFMNFSLRNTLIKYAPVTERNKVIKQVDTLLDALNGYGASIKPEDYNRSRAIALTNKVELMLKNGSTDFKSALPLILESRKLMRENASNSPENIGYQADLAISCEKVGDIYLLFGQADNALKSYRESLIIRKKINSSHPNNRNYLYSLAMSHQKMGDAYNEKKMLNQALSEFRNNLSIRQSLAKVHPEDVIYQRSLVVANGRLGKTYLKLGQNNLALEVYKTNLDTISNFVQLFPSNVQYLRDQAVANMDMGKVYDIFGETELALASYQQASHIQKKLLKSDPNNTMYQRDLSVTEYAIGDLHTKLGQINIAFSYYKNSFRIREMLVNTHPNILKYKYDLVNITKRMQELRLK
ncbi:hypothetical protein [Photobacterium kasasachensis]|uniref:nSTAND1 domain-containing NTPase n=1 Tax=Photobacterium kasasachensis TaxID=2910240 RepID=UPI003D0A8701